MENRRVSSGPYSKVDNLDIASSAHLRHSPHVTVAEHANRVQIYEPNTSSSSTLALPSQEESCGPNDSCTPVGHRRGFGGERSWDVCSHVSHATEC